MPANRIDMLLGALDRGEPPDPASFESRALGVVEADWDSTDDPAVLLRLCLHAGDRRGIVRAACACARLALRRVPPRSDRLLAPVEAAEAWSRGELSLDAVKQAAAGANSLLAREELDDVARAAIGAAGAASEDACVTNAAVATANVLATTAAGEWSADHARALVELAALVRATVANPLPELLDVANTSTAALFEELLRAPAPPAPSVRSQAVRAQLLRRGDLPQVLRAALDAEPPTHPQRDVLGAHWYQLGLRLAAALLDELPAVDAAPLLYAASRSPHPDVAGVVAPVVYRLAQRRPREWATVLDPERTGRKVLRWCLARLDGANAPPIGPEAARAVLQLAREGIALDLACPVLAGRLGDDGRHLLRELARDAALPADRRVGALHALGTVLAAPERFELARSLVEAETHAASWELVLAVQQELEAGGLDAAFALGHSARLFRTPGELGQAMRSWIESPPGPGRGVGLWPIHRGTHAWPEGRVLAPNRAPSFLVDGVSVWQVERQWWLEEEDPERVTLRHQLLAEDSPPITRERLARGSYLAERARVLFVRRPADGPGPGGPRLDVRWWSARGVGARDGWSAELALLPLRRAPGSRPPAPGPPLIHCWFMPEEEQLGARVRGEPPAPDHLRLHGVTLSGERDLDDAVDRDASIEVEFVSPLTFAGDRDLYLRAIASFAR